MTKTKKKKPKRRTLLQEYDAAVKIPRRDLLTGEITHIMGTLNAISSRLDDIWDYLIRSRAREIGRIK